MITTKTRIQADAHSSRNGKHRGVVQSFGDVVSDMTSLAELQFQLLMLDTKASGARIAKGTVLAVAALIILTGSIPVGLLAIAAVLYEFAEWPVSASIGTAFGIGVVLMAILFAVAKGIFNHSTSVFERSATEFKNNVEWLKTLKSSSKEVSGPESQPDPTTR